MGLLSEAELDAALAEQELTGRKLGEIIVARGFVSGPALTLALSEQFGVEVETETGYGSGLWAEIARRHQRGLGRELAGEGREPQTAEVPLPAYGTPEADEPRLRLVASQSRRRADDAGLAALDGRLEALQWQVEELTARLAQTESRLHDEGKAGSAESLPARFVLFVPLADRYELVERQGALPRIGSEVELSEAGAARFVVSKLGRSPLPVDPRPCVYLQTVA